MTEIFWVNYPFKAQLESRVFLCGPVIKEDVKQKADKLRSIHVIYLNPLRNPHGEIFRPQAKFLITWIPIEMTILPTKLVKQW